MHTSASLTINENASPDVPLDLADSLDRLVPEGTKLKYRHDDEGPDDMPAHVKSSLMGPSLTIPISKGKLALGTWQGVIYKQCCQCCCPGHGCSYMLIHTGPLQTLRGERTEMNGIHPCHTHPFCGQVWRVYMCCHPSTHCRCGSFSSVTQNERCRGIFERAQGLWRIKKDDCHHPGSKANGRFRLAEHLVSCIA